MSAHTYMSTMRRLYSLARSLDLPVDFTQSTTQSQHRPGFSVTLTVGHFSAEARAPNRNKAKTQASVLVLQQLESAVFSGTNISSKKKQQQAKTQDHSLCPDFCLDKDPSTRLATL
ncbi:hypothetical protein WMY93_033444 [Mugilogobius chulae]|uniref:DRBM domain-containing protein n=1 Tax=Mugilogobius chulae TaxID=88201 RepID=A0AAW0MK57_9GOBI